METDVYYLRDKTVYLTTEGKWGIAGIAGIVWIGQINLPDIQNGKGVKHL